MTLYNILHKSYNLKMIMLFNIFYTIKNLNMGTHNLLVLFHFRIYQHYIANILYQPHSCFSRFSRSLPYKTVSDLHSCEEIKILYCPTGICEIL